MAVPTDIINEILSDAHAKLLELPAESDAAVKYYTIRMERLIKELNAEYVYIKYKFSEHDKWDYAKFEKSWFETMDHDDLEDEVMNYPENAWMHDSWRSYSITYEKCTMQEYQKIKGY